MESLYNEIHSLFKKCAKHRDQKLTIRQQHHVSTYTKPQGSIFFFSDEREDRVLHTIRTDQMVDIKRIAEGYYRVKYNIDDHLLNPLRKDDEDYTELYFN